MSGHRRAAVALHGLNAEDRKWMLAELPAADQQILQQYLDELDELGFSYGPELAVDLAASPVTSPVTKPVKSDKSDESENIAPPGALQQLQKACAEQVLVCLQDEPASLIARLLALHDWPWREALLTQMSALARQRVRTLLADPVVNSHAPMLDEFLLDAVAARLRTQSFVAPQADVIQGPEKRGWFNFRVLRWNR
jgi:hypothetical protein